MSHNGYIEVVCGIELFFLMLSISELSVFRWNKLMHKTLRGYRMNERGFIVQVNKLAKSLQSSSLTLSHVSICQMTPITGFSSPARYWKVSRRPTPPFIRGRTSRICAASDLPEAQLPLNFYQSKTSSEIHDKLTHI